MKAEDIERAIAELEPRDLAEEEPYREIPIAGAGARKYLSFIEKLKKKYKELIEKMEENNARFKESVFSDDDDDTRVTNYGSGFFLDISDIDPFPFDGDE